MWNLSREDAKQYVGKGWSELIDTIYDRLPPTAHIGQVKEKYGGLRFYVDGVSSEVLDFIDEVEEQSYQICEDCGLSGKTRKGGWIKTLCDDHAQLSSRGSHTGTPAEGGCNDV